MEILKNTLRRLEEIGERDSTAMQALKRSITRALAELQVSKSKTAE
jgi:hypothetical protein